MSVKIHIKSKFGYLIVVRKHVLSSIHTDGYKWSGVTTDNRHIELPKGPLALSKGSVVYQDHYYHGGEEYYSKYLAYRAFRHSQARAARLARVDEEKNPIKRFFLKMTVPSEEPDWNDKYDWEVQRDTSVAYHIMCDDCHSSVATFKSFADYKLNVDSHFREPCKKCDSMVTYQSSHEGDNFDGSRE